MHEPSYVFGREAPPERRSKGHEQWDDSGAIITPRILSQAQKIRERLGGSVSLFDAFPEKPRGMHRRTYANLVSVHKRYAIEKSC